MPAPAQAVQVYGRKKTASAVATCKAGKGLIKVNGKPLEQIEPKALQFKLQEPLLIVGKERFAGVDIRIRVSGGGRIAQVYAIRQAVARGLVAYYQKYVDEQSKQEIKVSSRLRPQSEGDNCVSPVSGTKLLWNHFYDLSQRGSATSYATAVRTIALWSRDNHIVAC